MLLRMEIASPFAHLIGMVCTPYLFHLYTLLVTFVYLAGFR